MRTKAPKPRTPKTSFASPRHSAASCLVRHSIELEPGRLHSVDFNCAESPLSWLRTRRDAKGRRLIVEEQYCAGLRLHADFIAGQLMPKITSNWLDPVAAPQGVLGSLALTDNEKSLAARQRYRAALDAVGPELSPILVEICCHATGIEAAERILRLPRRSGKVVLDLALTRLARWYGLLAPEVSAKSAPLRSCARPDYRPPIPG